MAMVRTQIIEILKVFFWHGKNISGSEKLFCIKPIQDPGLYFGPYWENVQRSPKSFKGGEVAALSLKPFLPRLFKLQIIALWTKSTF